MMTITGSPQAKQAPKPMPSAKTSKLRNQTVGLELNMAIDKERVSLLVLFQSSLSNDNIPCGLLKLCYEGC